MTKIYLKKLNYLVKCDVEKEIEAIDEDEAMQLFYEELGNDNEALNNYVTVEEIKEKQKDEPQEFFPITTVAREDLEQEGFDASKVDDATMQRLADKMGDAYCDDGFWVDLRILAEYLEIPKKIK